MQNREELRKKGHDGSRKTTSREGEKISFSEGGGGINIVFGPKYRPLLLDQMILGTEYTECWPCPLFDNLLSKY